MKAEIRTLGVGKGNGYCRVWETQNLPREGAIGFQTVGTKASAAMGDSTQGRQYLAPEPEGYGESLRAEHTFGVVQKPVEVPPSLEGTSSVWAKSSA